MKTVLKTFRNAAFVLAAFCTTAVASPIDLADIDASIHILGETHDNPVHHANQAAYIARLNPTAVVFEMLLPEEADALSNLPRDAAVMSTAVLDFHWSNIADYVDVMAASDGQIIGAALPRGQARDAFLNGAAAVFSGDAAAFGLTTSLPKDQYAARAQLQFDAHCEAMPMDMMPGMIEAQRLRDAHFAKAVLDALRKFGAPVVLITGNGHARLDWGVPATLKLARPDVTIITIGQSEDGRAPEGGFDAIWDAPSVPDRKDPCAVFR